MSSRELTDWINTYIQFTDNSEPPRSYHLWTAISIIAAVLQRKVRLIWGHETLYPNMYITLVGPSGRARKGLAMGIGRDILSEMNIPLVSEAITREALIRYMHDSIQSYTDNTTGMIETHCSVTCFSEELSVLLGQNDIAFLSALTNWYDSRDEWTYTTKTAGEDKILGVCFNLLGATAPDWMSSMFPQEAIGGGFTSRMIFVVEQNKRKTVPIHQLTETEYRLRDALIRDLARIRSMSGEFEFTPEANIRYAAWYSQQDRLIEAGESPIPDPRFSGYVERRATHIRKLCMVLSASRDSDRVVTVKDFERSITVLSTAEAAMSSAFGGLGKSRYSEATEQVLTLLIQRGRLKRSELLKILYRDLDTPTLQVVEQVLTYMGVLEIEVQPMSSDCIYIYKTPLRKKQ